MKQINKISNRRFQVITGLGRGQTVLDLDFNPIVNALSDREKSFDYRLIHWQAQPRGDREWGIYNPQDDTYISSVFEDHPTAYGAMKMIMLDDATAATLPSSVIYCCGSLPIYNDSGISSSVNDTSGL